MEVAVLSLAPSVPPQSGAQLYPRTINGISDGCFVFCHTSLCSVCILLPAAEEGSPHLKTHVIRLSSPEMSPRKVPNIDYICKSH